MVWIFLATGWVCRFHALRVCFNRWLGAINERPKCVHHIIADAVPMRNCFYIASDQAQGQEQLLVTLHNIHKISTETKGKMFRKKRIWLPVAIVFQFKCTPVWFWFVSLVGAIDSWTSSFSTKHLASMHWAKISARRDENHLSFRIWCDLY